VLQERVYRALHPTDSSIICTEVAFRIRTTEIGLALRRGALIRKRSLQNEGEKFKATWRLPGHHCKLRLTGMSGFSEQQSQIHTQGFFTERGRRNTEMPAKILK
jgi:hypothetical protein